MARKFCLFGVIDRFSEILEVLSGLFGDSLEVSLEFGYLGRLLLFCLFLFVICGFLF